jgi:Kef-type K+ transport system membrane component KefB
LSIVAHRYLFDLTAARTKIPSVILLLLLGWMRDNLLFDINLPDLTATLPVLGTIGLILIVLEGSLELELNRSRTDKKSSIGAFLPLVILAFRLHLFTIGYSFRDSLINAIPFCVISSAIAIPSVRNLSSNQKSLSFMKVVYPIFWGDFLQFHRD